mmetsp:Transcript_5415/g.12939  ORF Transcript_5415/g.12939 Transcript_5415/m.12939 type:complete len:94 (+) Transcript_5415:75-356(+)
MGVPADSREEQVLELNQIIIDASEHDAPAAGGLRGRRAPGELVVDENAQPNSAMTQEQLDALCIQAPEAQKGSTSPLAGAMLRKKRAAAARRG